MTSGAPIPFTPPHYSLNRVRIVDLPGIRMDEGVRGETGFSLLSAWALMGYARARATELALPANLLDDTIEARWELPRLMGRLIDEGAGAQRGAAEAVASRVGRNLGHLLLTLQRGDQVNRDARPEWGDAEWGQWSAVRRVWLAGGLASGRLGQRIVAAAVAWLADAGAGDALTLAASPWGQHTALLGAARYLPDTAGAALCCDYGQTSIKRAIVSISDHAATRLDVLPRVSGRDEWRVIGDGGFAREGEMYREFVVDTICDALAQARRQGYAQPREIMISVAAYIDGGKLLGFGAYAAMSLLAPDARVMLADAISEREGQPCRVHLIHDGTAAAAAFAGQPNTALIAMGSALGVGFPPESAGQLLSIDDLSV